MAFYIDYLLPKILRTGAVRDRIERAKFGRLEGWVSIVANTVLFAAKLVVGIFINSLALIADAFHSFSDVLTSVVVLVGYALSEKPGDREHPYGHQRVEYVATLIVAILLAVVGFEFIRQGYHRIQSPNPVTSNWLIMVFILTAIAVKYLLGDYSRRIGQLINSAALQADAFHHYSDAASSILVLVAVFGSGMGYPMLDGLASILVGAFLIYGGFKIAKDSADTLIGQPPSPEMIARIRKICRATPRVLNAHDIIVHTYGENLFISVHVEINQSESSLQAHSISDAVELALFQELQAQTTIHIDPVDVNSTALQPVRSFLNELLPRFPEVREYHDLRLIKKPGHHLILFDLVPDAVPKKGSRVPSCLPEISTLLEKQFPNYRVEISVDPIYIYN